MCPPADASAAGLLFGRVQVGRERRRSQMSGHGDKLGRKEEQAILALLARPTIGEAASTVGIGEATLRRWLGRPDFRDRYREARRQVLEGAIANLQQATGDAAAALRRNLACGVPSVEVRSALGIIEQAIKGAELLDLAERIAVLEEQAAATEQQKPGHRAWRA